MIDFIDPTLKRSAESKRAAAKYSLEMFIVGLIIALMLGMTIWLIFVAENSQIDTVPEEKIDIDKKFDKIKFDGRIPSIEKTIDSQNAGQQGTSTAQ